MKIAIGADHNGYALKNDMKAFVQGLGHEVSDHGAHTHDPTDDYPDFAGPVAAAVKSGDSDRGILICGSGIGAAVTANKFRGVRASVCHDTYSAAQGVMHDDMNVLCVGARVVGDALTEKLIEAFLGASLESHPRFQRRLDKLGAIEEQEFSS